MCLVVFKDLIQKRSLVVLVISKVRVGGNTAATCLGNAGEKTPETLFDFIIFFFYSNVSE